MSTVTATPPGLPAAGSASARRRSRHTVRAAAGGAIALLFAFPIAWTTVGGFKPAQEANASPPVWWPSHWSLGSFTRLNSAGSSLAGYTAHSVVVAVATVVMTTVASVLAGYAFAFFRFRGQRLLFATSIAVLLVPYPALLISLFTVMLWFGLTNSLFGLALIYTTFQLPFATYMMRNSFESVPRELIEAAQIDGCTKITALPRVVLRLTMPGVVTVALFAFLAAWNEFMAALVMLNDNSQFTLPIALVNAQNGPLNTIDWGALQAGITVTMLPCVVLFMLLQRYYVAGLVAGTGK